MVDIAAFTTFIDYVAFFFGAVGAVLIIYGGLRAIVFTLGVELRRSHMKYSAIRYDFTQKLVFGLEFFIASDVLLTLISQRTLDNVAVLGAIVVIRTILGYFLSREARESREPEEVTA